MKYDLYTELSQNLGKKYAEPAYALLNSIIKNPGLLEMKTAKNNKIIKFDLPLRKGKVMIDEEQAIDAKIIFNDGSKDIAKFVMLGPDFYLDFFTRKGIYEYIKTKDGSAIHYFDRRASRQVDPTKTYLPVTNNLYERGILPDEIYVDNNIYNSVVEQAGIQLAGFRYYPTLIDEQIQARAQEPEQGPRL